LKLKNSDSSPRSLIVAEKLKRSLWFALVSSGVSLALAAPLITSASVFSIQNLLQVFTKETAAAGTQQNSQTIAILSPVTNIDPKPSVGGGDISVVGGSALLSVDGPSGTAADIAHALPEATTISVYTVHKGDTLSGIAQMFDVTVNTIMWANDLKNGTIREGQELVILPITGVRYTVQKGDTLASVAKKFKADAQEIENYNDLDGALAVGSTIIIPDGEVVVITPVRSTATGKTAPLRGAGGAVLSGYFSWPVSGGVVTQGLHGYNGIDIGAPTGTGILAAAGGTVIIANGGGAWNGGYGNYVVIQHDNGTQTLYAHASKVYVSSGQRVAQGALIGTVGRTGKATGSHLHFEVRGATNPFGR
jgi:LysM repeat protein